MTARENCKLRSALDAMTNGFSLDLSAGRGV